MTFEEVTKGVFTEEQVTDFMDQARVERDQNQSEYYVGMTVDFLLGDKQVDPEVVVWTLRGMADLIEDAFGDCDD